jgi:hypothetical protein
VTTASTEEAAPYTSVASIYRGMWLDEETERAAELTGAALWTRTAVAIDDWLICIRTPFGRWDGFAALPESIAIPQPWDHAIDDASFSVTNCVYMRGPVTHAITAPAAITLSGNTVFVAARIKLSDNTATLIQAATLAGVTDASWPADGTYIKRLLYKVERADESSPYGITLDYRNEPEPDTVPVAPSSPTTLHSGGSGENTGTADTTTWTAGNADGKGITIWNTMRLKDDTTAGKIYAFMRSLTFDMNGKLQAVSAETKVEISDSVTHSSQHPTT